MRRQPPRIDRYAFGLTKKKGLAARYLDLEITAQATPRLTRKANGPGKATDLEPSRRMSRTEREPEQFTRTALAIKACSSVIFRQPAVPTRRQLCHPTGLRRPADAVHMGRPALRARLPLPIAGPSNELCLTAW